MDDNTLMLYTYTLIDGRNVTFAGLFEEEAFNRAFRVHGYAVPADECGRKAVQCTCSEKHAESTRQGGWLICRDCAGYIG